MACGVRNRKAFDWKIHGTCVMISVMIYDDDVMVSSIIHDIIIDDRVPYPLLYACVKRREIKKLMDYLHL